jgi:hypothetical protein
VETTNGGITFTPVFQNEASYSIGAVVIDAARPNTIWIGTGEANNQRSVGWETASTAVTMPAAPGATSA